MECRRRSTSALTDESFSMNVFGLGHIGLGLVVVVIRHEVLDGVVRHEVAELVRQLRRQCLVVSQHQRGALHLLDEPRGGRRLAGAGGAQEDDVGLACVDARRELGDRLGLITRGEVFADDLERSNGACRLHQTRLSVTSDMAARVRAQPKQLRAPECLRRRATRWG